MPIKTKKINVLHVYKTYFPDSHGGIAETIRNLSNGMRKYNVTAEVLTMSPEPIPAPFSYQGTTVHQAKTTLELASTPISVDAFSMFRKLAPAFDIIHYHYPYPFADLLKFASWTKKPSIVTYHSDIVRQRVLKYAYAPIEKKFLNSADMIVCSSKKYAETSTNLIKYKDKVKTITLGLPDTSKSEPSAGSIAKWNDLKANPFFLFLGELRSYKGINTLLDASAKCNTTIVIAGGGANQPKYQEIAKNKNLNNIIFTGSITEDEKNFLLSLCYGLILPSNFRSEAFGLVLLEGAMRRKPLISTEIGTGTSFINEHGKTGLVIPPSNPEILSNAINFLVDHPNKAAEMGRAARKRFTNLFTAEKMCSDYYILYQECLEKNAMLKQGR